MGELNTTLQGRSHESGIVEPLLQGQSHESAMVGVLLLVQSHECHGRIFITGTRFDPY
jgi:hypothetical protein